jgi:hypothetical protein
MLQNPVGMGVFADVGRGAASFGSSIARIIWPAQIERNKSFECVKWREDFIKCNGYKKADLYRFPPICPSNSIA